MFCSKCGTQLPEDSGFCNKCGAKVIAVDTEEAAAAVPESSAGVVGYKECPEVPDFGAVIGIPLLRAENNSTPSKQNITYYYNRSDVTQANANAYVELAQKHGLEYLGCDDDELYAHQFSQGHRFIDIQICDDESDEFLVQIYESNAKSAEEPKRAVSVGGRASAPVEGAIRQQGKGSGGVRCPNCQSVNLQTIVESNTTGKGGFSAFDGCLGYLLMGPLGLLCGSRKTKIKTTNTTFFMCMDCGNKFKHDTWKKGMEQEQETLRRIEEHKQNVERFQTTGVADSKMGLLENAKKLGGTNEALEGSPANQANDRLVAHYGKYTYFVQGNQYAAAIHRETPNKGDIYSTTSHHKPKYLFADEKNLYFMADEDNKTFSAYKIYYVAHNSTEKHLLTDAKVDQIYCYGDYIYYINAGDKGHVYSIRKDGTENQKLIAEKVSHLIVYSDKIYFHSKTIKRADLNGGNMEIVLEQKPAFPVFRISGNSLYYEKGGPFNRTIYRLDLTSNKSVPVIEMRNSAQDIAIVINIINEYNILDGSIIGSQGDEHIHRWVRYDPDTHMTVNYDNVPLIPASGMANRRTVNIVNGVIYFGDAYGVKGRMPIDGGNYQEI